MRLGYVNAMATSRRPVRKHTQLEQIYGKYRSVGVDKTTSPADSTSSTSSKPIAQPYLSAEEATFVRRDLRRVGAAAAVALLIIVGVWLYSRQPGWTAYVDWVGRSTNF